MLFNHIRRDCRGKGLVCPGVGETPPSRGPSTTFTALAQVKSLDVHDKAAGLHPLGQLLPEHR